MSVLADSLYTVKLITFDDQLAQVLGPRDANKLKRAFGYETVEELLNHAPRKYLRRGELTPLHLLKDGEEVAVIAEVKKGKLSYVKGNTMAVVNTEISDSIGTIKIGWFNQRWRVNQLEKYEGKKALFVGKIKIYNKEMQLAHPDLIVFDDELAAIQASVAPIPVYPATARLRTWDIEKMVKKVLEGFAGVYDPLPLWVIEKAGTRENPMEPMQPMLALTETYHALHTPQDTHEIDRAIASLKFREAFELQLGLLYRKEQVRATTGVPRARVIGGSLDAFDSKLQFELTADQIWVGDVLEEELSAPSPMHRLLQGEVGSGKTVVALRGMLQITDTEGQAALLAPTEVLAGQHMRSITEMLGPELTAKLKPTLLTGQLSAAEKKSALLAIASGQAKIIIGTHALMSDATTFADLGLVVVDEQHRFGVEQRDALRKKGKLSPHVLVMTATPIPRTVALTAFGDLEISTLTQLPAGRVRIESHVVPVAENPRWLDRGWIRAAEEIDKGRQVYVVCPAIKSDGKIELRNVEDTLELVRAHPRLSKYRSAALTGEMPSDKKDEVMRDFAAGKIDILVATTVIEVGVNVPNASLMIVLDADRFGVSQLHQLRGRVGRGEHPGLCLFVTDFARGTPSRARVEAVAATLDGFKLAQVDLEQRREGDILGARQSGGVTSLRWIKVAHDIDVIERAGEFARALIEHDPQLNTVTYLRKNFAKKENAAQITHLHKS